MMLTLNVSEQVGNSVLGTAQFSNRYHSIEIGKCLPLVRTGEDIEGLARSNFIEESTPIEFNILSRSPIQNALNRVQTAFPTHRESWQEPTSILTRRPSVGYVPPECFVEPTKKAKLALVNSGKIGERVSELRSLNPDGSFWTAIAKDKLLIPFVRELLRSMKNFNGDLFTPPVPVVNANLKTSPKIQGEVNRAIAGQWPIAVAGSFTNVGLLYSLHFHPSAFNNKTLIRNALFQLSQSLSGDLSYWGIHINFIDISLVTKKASRIKMAKELVQKAARIGRQHGVFTWVSDVGPIGPAMLDLGAAFCSYYTGITPRATYLDGFKNTPESGYGKVLGLWDFNLHDIKDLKNKDWQLEDTGLISPVVPQSLRSGKFKDFRVNFGKPNNVAVMERLNIERLKELEKKNINPGISHLGRSSDINISPWAAL